MAAEVHRQDITGVREDEPRLKFGIQVGLSEKDCPDLAAPLDLPFIEIAGVQIGRRAIRPPTPPGKPFFRGA